MSEPGERGGLRIAGIPLVLPWSSLVGVALLTWLFAPGFADGSDSRVGVYAIALVFAVLVYGAILVHELAHAAAARAFGFPVHEIRLYALGGYTAYERRVHTPGRELVIALAGPFMTLALAALCWLGYRVSAPVMDPGALLPEFLGQLAFVGVALGIYNLLPGIPLDGGALVKCTVWKLTGSEPRGTRAGAWAGLVIAVAVFALPFLGAWRRGGPAPDITTVVAVAIFASWLGMGALDALRRSRVQERLPSLTAGDLAVAAVGVSRDLPLSEGLRLLGASGAGSMVVVGPDGLPVGIANAAAVVAVPEQRRPYVTVGSVSRSVDPARAIPATMAGEELLAVLGASEAPDHLVADSAGTLVGVLRAADVEAALRAA